MSFSLIPLTRGEFAIIDNEDFESVSKYKWHLGTGKRCRYARRMHYTLGSGRSGKRTLWALHRFVLGFPKGSYIDHINGNSLDNRKSNLRICTNFENCRNQKMHKGNVSGFKGVSPSRNKHKSWRATILVNGQQVYLGSYYDKRTAALAYNGAAIKHFGTFAKLNDLRGFL